MPSWIDLPNELRLEILQQCFQGLRFEHKFRITRTRRSQTPPHPLFLVAKSFANADEVQRALVSTATIILPHHTVEGNTVLLNPFSANQIRLIETHMIHRDRVSSLLKAVISGFSQPQQSRLFPNLRAVILTQPVEYRRYEHHVFRCHVIDSSEPDAKLGFATKPLLPSEVLEDWLSDWTTDSIITYDCSALLSAFLARPPLDIVLKKPFNMVYVRSDGVDEIIKVDVIVTNKNVSFHYKRKGRKYYISDRQPAVSRAI